MFLSVLEKYLFPSSLGGFWLESHCHLDNCSTIVLCTCFFTLSLDFRNLIMSALNVFEFILFRVHSVSWIYRFMPFTKFVEFSAIFFFSEYFSAHILPFLGYSDNTNVRQFLFQASWDYGSFFSLFFLLVRMGPFYFSVFMFMESFLWHQHSTIEHIHWVYFTYYIFYFYNFHLFLLYIFCFLAETFYYFCFFKSTCNCSVKHFCDCFTLLVRWFQHPCHTIVGAC